MTRYVIAAILFLVSVSGFAQVQTQVIGDSVIVKSNNGFVVKTNDKQRLSVWADGTVSIGASDATSKPIFRFYENGDLSAGANNDYTYNQFTRKNGIRYNRKLGIFEIGVSNNIDTSMSPVAGDSTQFSALIINSGGTNTITGRVNTSVISGSNMNISGPVGGSLIAGNAIAISGFVYAAPVIGENHLIVGNVSKSFINGYGHRIYAADCRESFINGTSNYVNYKANSNLINGFVNSDLDSSYSNLVTGSYNTYSGTSQLIAGIKLISKGFGSTTLGSANVDFTSLAPVKNTQPSNLQGYPLFAIGNSGNFNTIRSNAFTMLYNGRTQINTTGYDSTLTETDVTPKAALEVVSKNSGVLLPKLTTAQRDSIVSGDRHNGLLLYNTDSSRFQFYNGSAWKTIGDNASSSGNAYAIQSLADDDTIIWNGTGGDNSSVLLEGANRALSITNPVQGHTYRIKIKQDSTGNKTIANWPSGVLWPSGNPPVLSTAPEAIDMVTLYYDGTNFFGDYKLLYKAFTYDPDAQKYFDSVATTGSLTLTEKNAWNNFVMAAKAGTNYWGNIAVINPVLGATSAEHAWNAKDPSTFKATYSGTITHTANHMVSNGTTGYVNSHFNMNTNDGDGLATIAVWVRNNVDAVAVAMGAISATNRYTQIYPRFGNTFYGQVNTNNAISEAVTVSTSVGLSLATRLTSTGTYIQRNATQTGGTTSSLITNNDIYVLAQNSNGSAANFSTYQVCMYMIATTPFTTAQASQFYTDFSTFIAAVGR